MDSAFDVVYGIDGIGARRFLREPEVHEKAARPDTGVGVPPPARDPRERLSCDGRLGYMASHAAARRPRRDRAGAGFDRPVHGHADRRDAGADPRGRQWTSCCSASCGRTWPTSRLPSCDPLSRPDRQQVETDSGHNKRRAIVVLHRRPNLFELAPASITTGWRNSSKTRPPECRAGAAPRARSSCPR